MIGKTIGPYQILGELGRGGMGEVYRAKDTNLNRDVAIKILPESFALDADRVARFKREAQVLASLNHPNIAAIYGIESNALVMELVEGEDLSTHIGRGAIPLADALPIARQIADALEAAHEQGIVHRDLKPQNIKVRADGTVKVLDFGLAKAVENVGRGFSRADVGGPGAAEATPYESPTMTSPAMTAMGMIIGTAAYMSPEQARGRPVDRRADIWAFGVVLYEMLSGRRAFEGDDISITLANVLKDDVKLDLLPADLPAALRRLLRRCLEKDPRKRLSSIGDARLELDDAIAGTREAPQGEPVASGRWTGWARLSIGLALVSVALATWLAASALRRPSADLSPPVIARFSLVSDPNLRVNTSVTTPFAVSRDGQSIVFSGDACSGTSLWMRTLADAEPHVLADTVGAYNPAISPDGKWAAFVVANHQIKKIRLDGTGLTTVLTIDDATAALAWTSNDEIIFEKIGSNSGIHRVSANGGASPQLLIPLDAQANERSQRRPLVLLDERRVLYQSSTSDGRTATIAVFSLDDGRRVRLEVEGTQPLGVVDGQLVYTRKDGALMAVPFDASGMRVLGPSRQLADQVAVSGFGTPVTLSPGGTLVAAPPSPQLAQLLLSDLTGKTTSIIGPARDFGSALFSPDGRRIAASIGDDLWFVDPVSGEPTRLTREKGGSLTDWTKDSTSLVFTRNAELWITPVDGSSGPRKLGPVEGTVLGASMLPDRKSVVVARRMNGAEGEVDREELVRVPLDGAGEVTTIIASRSSGATMRFGEVRVSPNGKWVAFQERNGQQIHVHALDGPSAVQVSDTGGNFPVWSADSRRIFYQASTGAMVADLETGTPLGVRRQSIPALSCSGRVVDASSDGRTLLVRAATVRSSKVMVTLNWAAQLRRELGK